MTTISLVSLGCAKNTVDSQSILALMKQAGYEAINEPQKADAIIVNTCGFIGAARDETLEVLQEFAGNKAKGQILVAAGCMAQLFEPQIRDNNRVKR